MFWWVLQAVANESILWYSAGAHALQELLLGCLPRMLSPFVGVSGHVSSTVIPIPSWKGLMCVLGRGCLNPSLVYLNFIFFLEHARELCIISLRKKREYMGRRVPKRNTHTNLLPTPGMIWLLDAFDEQRLRLQPWVLHFAMVFHVKEEGRSTEEKERSTKE